MSPQKPTPHPAFNKQVGCRDGGWLPPNQDVIECWLKKQVNKFSKANKSAEDFHPVIQEFKTLIESDAAIYLGFHHMFDQVPFKYDPRGEPHSQVKDYMTMLAMFNHILTQAPEYENNDLVGCPFNAILDWPMGTPAGYTMFTNSTVNAQFKKMLDVWASFLTSPESREVLNDGDNGWFGPLASAQMPNFAETYVCDPSAEYYGFTSWDNFFTRRFQDGKRPVDFPTDNKFLNSPCESTVYRFEKTVNAYDTFWLKGQPYSLHHMLNDDPLTPQFLRDDVGGSVFQAFLSALDYHRWHSPVNGRVVKTVQIPGTYFAESPVIGFDPAGPNLSQSFISHMATRALIFIEADNPDIGLMCFVAVGMAEVSTCEISVWPGDILKKGEELGMFHFGGSTFCLVFRPETNFILDPDYAVGKTINLNAAIATIEPASGV